jgi:hypothetical protein
MYPYSSYPVKIGRAKIRANRYIKSENDKDSNVMNIAVGASFQFLR